MPSTYTTKLSKITGNAKAFPLPKGAGLRLVCHFLKNNLRPSPLPHYFQGRNGANCKTSISIYKSVVLLSNPVLQKFLFFS